jgi:hypothetical protein
MSARQRLIGRSSSHFTRVARLFAHELEVEHDFSPVYEIASTDAGVFGDDPSLRVPSLRTRLSDFVAAWSRRPSALATPYGFDRPG